MFLTIKYHSTDEVHLTRRYRAHLAAGDQAIQMTGLVGIMGPEEEGAEVCEEEVCEVVLEVEVTVDEMNMADLYHPRMRLDQCHLRATAEPDPRRQG